MHSLVSFVINSFLLGVGLAMDAFSVSVANGLHDPAMPGRSRLKIAGVFAFFQFLFEDISGGSQRLFVLLLGGEFGQLAHQSAESLLIPV